jgi:hypothetical protein
MCEFWKISLWKFKIQMCMPLTHTTPSIEQRAPNSSESQLDSRWPHVWYERNLVRPSVNSHSCNVQSETFQFQIQMCTQNSLTTQFTTIETASSTQVSESTTRNPFVTLECCNDDLHLLRPVFDDEHGFFFCIGLGQSVLRSCPQVMIFAFQLQMSVDNPNFTTTSTTTMRIYCCFTLKCLCVWAECAGYSYFVD